jgi:hypothetical protein
MAEVADGYRNYYADRIWNAIPGVYRANDSDDPDVDGPLRELVGRIAAQVAVVRRSIDRLWADQSIETSDDWVVPYIADLLDTKLVNGLDARGQRLDVAKTIHYRRRKGTVAVLEEIARDITGWDAHVVEAFRRLSRTRHRLDVPVGPGLFAAALPTPCPRPGVAPGAPDVTELLHHEGLLGELSGTQAGGFADLRSVHGATLTDSPFDELFHTADVRRGEGRTGWYGIPKLLVFLWRLQSFAVIGGTPVPIAACPGEWVFDPTGRHGPLFLPPLPPEPDDYADTWTSSREWEVPGPLTQSLLGALDDAGAAPPAHAPYPDRADVPELFAVFAGAPPEPVAVEVWPEAGQFRPTGAFEGALGVSYQYGFPGEIGAGPYDRTLLGDPPARVDPEEQVSGGTGLDVALTDANGTGTVTIRDSLTYGAVADVAPVSLLVRAGDGVRPLVRLPSPANAGNPPVAWTFTGGAGAELTLDGLFVSGGDIVLRGAFASVRLTGCTADPGTLNAAGDGYTESADGRGLAPVRIWIEADPAAAAGAPGAIERLEIDHCVLGPVRTRHGGAVEEVAIRDSVVQGTDPAGGGLTVDDPELLVRSLAADNPLSAHILGLLSNTARDAVTSYQSGLLSATALGKVVSGLNAVIGGASIYGEALFADVTLPEDVAALVAEGAAADTGALNLGLLEAAFPVPLAPAALALAAGAVDLRRVTVLGDAYVHRLSASDSILAGLTVAEDAQDGCIRFSAVLRGSRVPRRYLSVSLVPGAAVFTSTSFGNPAYSQLLDTADRAIDSGATRVTITAGAESGSEMGAWSSLLAPVKEKGLLVKYAEYMPLGLTPVVVHVT